MKLTKEQITKIGESLCTIVMAIIAIICILLGVTSCTTTRTITNTSQYHTKGDTTTIIQTKTTEIINLQKTQDLWK